MSIAELACTYAALALSDDGIAPTAEKISELIKAANIKVDSFWPALFAKLLEKKSVEDLISSVGAGGGGGSAPAAVSGGGAAAPAAEEKKEEKVEPEEESDEDMGFTLFD